VDRRSFGGQLYRGGVALIAGGTASLKRVQPAPSGDNTDVMQGHPHISRPLRSGVSVVIPLWNGLRWLPGCLASLADQTVSPERIIVVDNDSTDGSPAYLRQHHPQVEVLPLECNTGFAHAANEGIARADTEFVVLLNTDVVLDPDWIARMAERARNDPHAGSIACKMLQLDSPGMVYDAGDVLRRDGACEQRGRFGRDDGRWDVPGEVFGACAGAALYRTSAVTELGGFDERYFAYIEDVDLSLRLRLAGWRCLYEPVIAHHAGEGSSYQLPGGHQYLVERNTLFLVAKAFPARWLPFVAYRQLSWTRSALRQRRLSHHLRGALAGIVMAWRARRDRRELRRQASVPIEVVVPKLPLRGPAAGGHPAQRAERPRTV
jgi:GT2 family glycosyltransferase